ncbi:MAG: hypothetical protein HY252_08805 [Sphingobacteriales bacterium]|nr:hypothetical protein [Sphingobacteriales bacterium]
MYSPLNSLEEMWNTPHYILFKVLINGKEYYGRPGNAIAEPFDKIISARFNRYNSLLSAQSSSVGEEVIIKPSDIMGLEAFDIVSSKSPSPFSKILDTCNTIGQVEKISEMTLLLIDNLIDAIEEFIKEHPKTEEEGVNAIDLLNQTKIHFTNEEYSSENTEYLKNGISDIIENFFHLQN